MVLTRTADLAVRHRRIVLIGALVLFVVSAARAAVYVPGPTSVIVS